MKYWEIVAERLSAAGWSWGIIETVDSDGTKLFTVDAHHCDSTDRHVVCSDELLTAFLELERCCVNEV